MASVSRVYTGTPSASGNPTVQVTGLISKFDWFLVWEGGDTDTGNPLASLDGLGATWSLVAGSRATNGGAWWIGVNPGDQTGAQVLGGTITGYGPALSGNSRRILRVYMLNAVDGGVTDVAVASSGTGVAATAARTAYPGQWVFAGGFSDQAASTLSSTTPGTGWTTEGPVAVSAAATPDRYVNTTYHAVGSTTETVSVSATRVATSTAAASLIVVGAPSAATRTATPRVSRLGTESLYAGTSPDRRVSQAAVETLLGQVAYPRISDSRLDTLLSNFATPRVARLGVEVLVRTVQPGSAEGTARVTLPRLGANLVGATGAAPRTGQVAVVLPRLRAGATGTTFAPRTGQVAVVLPRLGATVAATVVQPPRTGSVASTLPRLRAGLLGQTINPNGVILTGTLPRLSAHLAGDVEGLGALLPALVADLEGFSPRVTRTDRTFANDGYTYGGSVVLDYDPPVADAPPGLARKDVRRVHQSLPTPTLVRGRPT